SQDGTNGKEYEHKVKCGACLCAEWQPLNRQVIHRYKKCDSYINVVGNFFSFPSWCKQVVDSDQSQCERDKNTCIDPKSDTGNYQNVVGYPANFTPIDTD